MTRNERNILRTYQRGNSAFYNGLTESDCPHYGGPDMSAWKMGFHDGQDGVETDSEVILNRILGFIISSEELIDVYGFEETNSSGEKMYKRGMLLLKYKGDKLFFAGDETEEEVRINSQEDLMGFINRKGSILVESIKVTLGDFAKRGTGEVTDKEKDGLIAEMLILSEHWKYND